MKEYPPDQGKEAREVLSMGMGEEEKKKVGQREGKCFNRGWAGSCKEICMNGGTRASFMTSESGMFHLLVRARPCTGRARTVYMVLVPGSAWAKSV